MSSTTLRRTMVSALVATLATGGLVATATGPAAAAPTAVSGVTFQWTGSEELQKAPPFGGGNPFTAGTSNGTMTADAYSAAEGNVSIVHVASDGTETPATFATRNAQVSGDVDQVVRFAEGTGSVEDDGSGSITWDGDWSVNFYGGLLPFTLSDPVLTVAADGTGELTADLVGYASDQTNPMIKEPLPPVADVTVATFSGVDLSTSGDISVDPDYEGVEVEIDAETVTPQNRTSTGWGAWPQDFVDFHLDSGLSSYWYSSGGAADPYKAPTPFTVSVPDQPAQVGVSSTVANPDGTTTVTVSGTGFDPSLATAVRPPLAGQPGGTYVTFGKFAETWKPSDGAGGATRVGVGTKWAVPAVSMATIGGAENGAVELTPAGTFTTQITLDKPALDALVATKANAADLVTYGIYTYAGGGATQPLYETFTPVTFVEPEPPIQLTDIAGLTFEPEITWLAGQGITTGYANGDGTFSYQPSSAVLREQMAAFLYRFQHDGTNPGPDTALSTFGDVPTGHVFSRHIAWLADQGITTGYAGNRFQPGQPVLREQMAAFLYRLADSPDVEVPATSPFADIPTTHTFYREIVWLESTGITTGYAEGNDTTTFKGSQPVLREQMAAFLYRFDRLDR